MRCSGWGLLMHYKIPRIQGISKKYIHTFYTYTGIESVYRTYCILTIVAQSFPSLSRCFWLVKNENTACGVYGQSPV